MREILIHKLHQYLRENNPDLLLQLEERGNVTEYLSGKMKSAETLLHQLEGKPGYIIEEACMDALTQDLRPSKYHYLCKILEEEFETTYRQFRASGTLTFEVSNLVHQCQPVFDSIGFSEENEDSRQLQYTITGAINEYLESNK